MEILLVIILTVVYFIYMAYTAIRISSLSLEDHVVKAFASLLLVAVTICYLGFSFILLSSN